MKKNKGLAMHCHHETLFEYCYDFQDRVDYIKHNKPKNEIKTRLKLFKLLSPAAIKALPEKLAAALAECDKALAEYAKALAEYDKALAECDKAWAKARAEYDKAWAKWDKALAEWAKVWAKAWHEKYCGCKEWNGERLIFERRIKQ